MSGYLKLITGPMYARKCLSLKDNIKVYKNGEKTIVLPKDIKVNDVLFSPISDTYNKVLEVKVSDDKAVLYDIISGNSIAFSCTYDHPMVLYDGSKIIVKPLSYIINDVQNYSLVKYNDKYKVYSYHKFTVKCKGPEHYLSLVVENDSIYQLANDFVVHNTSTMLVDIDRYNIANKKCCIVKHSIDDRYDSKSQIGIVTHDNVIYKNVDIYTSSKLKDIEDIVMKYDVIGIDEIQFFDDVVEAHKWSLSNKIVICSGIIADFEGKCFKNMHKLLPLVDDIITLKSVCMNCNSLKGTFSHLIVEDKQENQINIGGKDKYISICRNCLIEVNHPSSRF